MTLTEFVAKWQGKYLDFDGVYGPQCVDLTRQYLIEVLGFPNSSIKPVVGARDMYEKYDTLVDHDLFDRIPNTPDSVPNEGDIVLWRTGTYGHVAVFIEGDIKSFRSFDQNYPVGTPCHVQNHTYSGVLGWLQAKTVSLQDELDRVRLARDEHWNTIVAVADVLKVEPIREVLVAEVQKFLTYEDIIKKKDEEIGIKANTIVELQKKVEEITSQANELLTAITEAQKTNVDQAKEIEHQKDQLKAQEQIILRLGDRIEAIKKDLTAALEKALAGRNGFEIIWIGLKKLFIG